MQLKRTYIIGAAVALLIILFALRDTLAGIAVLLVVFAITALPTLLVLGGIGVVGFVAYRYLTTQESIALPPALTIPAGAPRGTRELSNSLATSFRRNNPRKLQHALAALPPWPITRQLQATTDALFELKRSIYRAQAEGVPTPMIDRYLQNLDQAAATVWQLASKVDAVGIQRIPYELVAPRLQQEELTLEQLRQALTGAHEGVALLILSGAKSDVLHEVEDDLRALTQAIKHLELAEAQP